MRRNLQFVVSHNINLAIIFFSGCLLCLWFLVSIGSFLAILRVSFDNSEDGFLSWLWSLDNWQFVLDTDRYIEAILTSAWISILTATVSLTFALPVGRCIAIYGGRISTSVVLPLLTLPYCSSYALRLFSIQSWLSGLNIKVLYTSYATIIGQLSVSIPLVAVFCYFGYARIPPSLLSAAENLGISIIKRFYYIELPLVGSLIFSGWIFAFVLSLGDALGPFILGGGKPSSAATVIIDRTKIGEWPSAAAVSILLIITLLVPFVFILFILLREKRC